MTLSTIEHRYQVICVYDSFTDFEAEFSRKQEAIDHGWKVMSRYKRPDREGAIAVEVWDTMARKGQNKRWRLDRKNWPGSLTSADIAADASWQGFSHPDICRPTAQEST